MPHYTTPDSAIHFVEVGFESILPPNCVQVTDGEAQALRSAANPSTPTSVDMAQARLALLGAGLLTTVDQAIAAMTGPEGEAARIEWEFRPRVRRDSPLVVALASALSLDEAALDALFVTASAL